MELLETIQPRPDADALGLFAEASIALAANSESPSLRQHAERLATLTHSDLVMLYEAADGGGALALIAQWGLPPDVETRFRTLDDDQSTGAGGLRAVDGNASPLSYHPRTQDLQDLGIRAYWGYPLWKDGELVGQLFFGSRDWDRFHQDTLSVFAATTLQIASALDRRRASSSAVEEPGWSESGGRAAVRKRQEFIAVLAHELRNPIAPIRTGIDLIATGLLDDEARRSTVTMMQRQVAHLVRLIDDLLDTVRLSTGMMQVKREPSILRDVVRSAIESIRPALQSKAQALQLDDVEAEVTVDVDPVRLSQAFTNILSTNVKQTPEGGVIRVRVARHDERLQVTFEDESPGSDIENRRNVFSLFPKPPLQSSQEGLGIGLALVKGLVELNDGTIDVRARDVGYGTAYTVVLPISNLPMPWLESDAELHAATWPSHRILVVDDNRDAADTLGLLFELDGHTVRLAHDGTSAVAEADEFQPEVILMDIGLPGFSGHEATRRIRARQRAVRPYVIALTGWGAHEDRVATEAAGCDLHLVKPMAHDALRDILREVTSSIDAGQARSDPAVDP